MGVEVNTFTISPTVVVIAAKSKRIARELEARGIDPVRIDYSEVARIPGSFRCSTMPLVREGLHIDDAGQSRCGAPSNDGTVSV